MDVIPLSTLIIVSIVLLFVSAFFSISETSMMALNRYRLKYLARTGKHGARRTTQLLAQTDRLLGMVLFGNNLLNAAIALLVGEIARRSLGDSSVALFVAMGVATFVILVFSEITPKVIGATYPERIALPSSFVLVPLMRISRPVVGFINVFVHGLLWMLRLQPAASAEQKLSMEELRTLVLEAGNFIPKKHQSVLLNLLGLEAITVEDAMTPRNQIEAIDLDAPINQLREQIATAYHRWLPVFRGQLDEIVGVIHVRNFLNLSQAEEITKENLQEIIREPYFVPASTPLFSQLQHFQAHKDRLAMVVDEYGELMGLISLEDILEEVVGEFTTQSPLHTGGILKEADGSYLVEGSSLLRELNRKLALDFPLDGPKTLNGLILEHFQDIPEPNTSVKIAGYPLEIIHTQDRVVKAVRIHPPTDGRPGPTDGSRK